MNTGDLETQSINNSSFIEDEGYEGWDMLSIDHSDGAEGHGVPEQQTTDGDVELHYEFEACRTRETGTAADARTSAAETTCTDPDIYVITKDSYNSKILVDWVRAQMQQYVLSKRSNLEVCKSYISYNGIKHRTPTLLKDLSSCAYIYDAGSRSTAAEEVRPNTDDVGDFTSNPLSANSHLHICKCDMQLAKDEKPGSQSSIIGYLGTNWVPKGQTSCSKPTEIKVWCFYLLSDAVVRKILVRKGRDVLNVSQSDLGPSLCVPLPMQREMALLSQVGPVQAQALKRKEQTKNLDDIEDNLLDLLIVQHGMLRMSEQEGEVKFEERKKDLKGAIHQHMLEMMEKLKDQSTRWPDYVFEDSFVLPNIYSVLQYAKEVGHLEGVPSEQDILNGQFDSKKVSAGILKYVEMQLLWLNDHAEKIINVSENVRALEDQVICLQNKLNDSAADQERSSADQESIRMELLRRFCPEKNPPLESTKKRLSLRDYQKECVSKCIENNTIISLPTGYGKTIIAVHVIDFFLRKYPSKHVVFVVPTKALVDEQAKYIRENSETPVKVAQICGQEMDGWRKPQWDACLRSNNVLVGTAEVFRRALIDFNFISASQFSLLVFDECHNATGNSPMASIMLDSVVKTAAADCPRIVGMTASFVNGALVDLSKKRKELERLLKAQIWCPEVEVLSRRIFQAVHYASEAMDTLDERRRIATESVASFFVPLSAYASLADVKKAARDAANVLVEVGRSAFIFFLREVLLKSVEAKAEGFLQGDDLRLQNQARLFMGARDRLKAELQARAAKIECSPFLEQAPTISSKAKKLLEILTKEGAETKGIIFVDRIMLAVPLGQVCSEAGFSTGAVVGASAMTDSVRKSMLNDFRNGKTNLLVSTCALEEGIDVSDCEFIIRFNRFDTTKGHIQGSGRARADNARIYYFDNDPEKELQREAELQCAARDSNLGLKKADLAIRDAPEPIQKVHPFKPDGTAEVNFYNCHQIFVDYCSKVMGQSVPPEELREYQEEIVCAFPRQVRKVLIKVSFPSPDGFIDISRNDVDLLWGDLNPSDLPDSSRRNNMTPVDLEKMRFYFAAVVTMRRKGVLTDENLPSADALSRTRMVCDAIKRQGRLRVSPKKVPVASLQQTVDATTQFQAAEAHESSTHITVSCQNHEDFKSRLNSICGKIWKRSDVVKYTTVAQPNGPYGEANFLTTLSLLETGDKVIGNVQRSKRAAEQTAASKALLLLENQWGSRF